MSRDSQYIDQTFRRAVYLERLKQSMVNDFGLTLKQIDKRYMKRTGFNPNPPVLNGDM